MPRKSPNICSTSAASPGRRSGLSASSREVPNRANACCAVSPGPTCAEIAASAEAVKGKTEMDALVAYLQSLGKHVK